jgi:glyoxylase-like metal-dependent hydrolase (beta-lactamase superfamily II)/rhodanese-related sulfurtransferase
MKIDQIYTGCLAQGAYYIHDNGEAAIIDPLREVAHYVEKLKHDGVKLKYIFETHFHADFVSGHIDLAKATGATIVYGPKANPDYDVHVAEDGEIFPIGNITIEALHTPGHTMESTTYLLKDESGKDTAIFSGDTLFIGDVGRPDLAVKTDLTREDLAALLFDSLRNKIMPLSDDIIVYPGHGAGSACGKNMSDETTDTLGHQKETNYALREGMTKEEFVKEVTEGILPAPQYFAKNAAMNKEGYGSFEKVLERGLVPLSVETFESIANHEGAIVLDTRERAEFAKGYIPKSLYIGLDGSFAGWVGTLIVDIEQPIIFVTDPGFEEEVVTRLARVGYDNTLGYLEGGFDAWEAAGKDVETMDQISSRDLKAKIESGEKINILDVRRVAEFEAERIPSATSFPLDYINEQMDSINRDETYYVHCVSGYRSLTANTILKPRGFTKVVDVIGGLDAIRTSGIELTELVETEDLEAEES